MSTFEEMQEEADDVKRDIAEGWTPPVEKDVHNVCAECGISANVVTCLQRYGRPPTKLSYDTSTFRKGICDYCGVLKFITETRDFFYPEFDLLGKVARLFAKGN